MSEQKIIESVQKALDKSSKIEHTLEDMKNVSVSQSQNNIGNSNPTKLSFTKVGGTIMDSVVILILLVLYGFFILNTIEYAFLFVEFASKYIWDWVYIKEYLILALYFYIIILIPMIGLNVRSSIFEFMQKVLKFFWFIVLACFILGFIFNGGISTEDQDVLVETQQEKVFSVFDHIGCYMKDFKACSEKKENTNNAEQSDITNYNIKVIKPTISNYKDLSDYVDDGMRVQYEIESSGDLVLKEFRCYATSKKTSNIFYKEELNEEIENTKPEIKTFYCNNFSKSMFGDKHGDVDFKIYPELVFDLKSKISQQVPVLNAQKLDDNELEKEIDEFGKTYTEFFDSGAKLQVSSENFKKQMPVILGDDKETDRSFTIVIKKKISSFGRFYSGEITDVSVPSSIVLTKDKSKYLGKIDLYDEVHGIDLDIKDNEAFASSLELEKIVQMLNIDYVSTFRNSALVDIKVKVPKTEVVSENSNSGSSSSGSSQNNNSGNGVVGSADEDPNKEISAIRPGIVG